jgi:hypothetical protein
MKLFYKFFGNKSVSVKTEGSGRTNSSHTSGTSGRNGHNYKTSNKNPTSQKKLPTEIIPKKPTRFQIAEAWIQSYNNHNADELLNAFVSGNSHVHLEDGFSTNAKTFCDCMKRIYETFPNFIFHYGSIKLEDEHTVSWLHLGLAPEILTRLIRKSTLMCPPL